MATRKKTRSVRKAAKKTTRKTAPKVTGSTKKSTKKSTRKKVAKKASSGKKTKRKTSKASLPKPASKPVSTSASASSVGQSAPALSVASTGGGTLDLSSLGGRVVVLYFYPKDATPGCTLEGQDFTRLHKQFQALGAEVFGVSRDSLSSHEKFKAKQSYSIDLLSDSDEKLCQAFGVIKMKNMYGRQVRGIERSTFVIGADGKVAKEWRGVKVAGHAEEVLNFVKSL